MPADLEQLQQQSDKLRGFIDQTFDGFDDYYKHRDHICQTIELQVQANTGFLTEMLSEYGFEQEFALKVAKQIAVKPVMFSLVTRIKTAENINDYLIFYPINEQEFQNLNLQNRQNYINHNLHYFKQQFESIAGEYCVYLYDHILDSQHIASEENKNHDNPLSLEIEKLIQNIKMDPEHIYKLLGSIKNSVLHSTQSPNLVMTALLKPIIQNYVDNEVPEYLINDYLHTVGDVLTGEVMAHMLLSDEPKDGKNYPVVPTYLEQQANTILPSNHDFVSHYARLVLINQGLSLVMMSNLLNGMMQTKEYWNPGAIFSNVNVFNLVSNLLAVVRILDDVPDLERDVKRVAGTGGIKEIALNIVYPFQPNVLDTFLDQAKLTIHPQITSLLKNAQQNFELNADKTGFIITNSQELFTKLGEFSNYALDELEYFAGRYSNGSNVIRAIRAVLGAAFLNAKFPDKESENL